MSERSTAPIVSVCVPTFDGAAVVEESLRSVLAQDLEDIEVIVTDDASSDGTLDVVRSVAASDDRVVTLPSTKHVGPTVNWWAAVQRSRGEFVKVMGQDDLLRADCLVRQVGALREHPGVALTACRRQIIGPTGDVVRAAHGLPGILGQRSGRDIRRAMLRCGTNPIGEPVATLCRRVDLLAAGAFGAEHGYVTDLERWLRLLDHGDLWGDPEPLVSFRLHASSWTSAVVREHGAAMRSLFQREAALHPNDIGRVHLWAGLAASVAANAGRRLVLRRAIRA